jgi:hypothetical protein
VRRLRFAICALVAALASAGAARAQNGPITGITFSSTGRPAGGVNVAICGTLATTAASVTNNVATLTFASNPITQGFVTGQALTVFGFTGGDTYFNGAFIISSTSPTTISYNLVNANGSAGSNGTVYQTGNRTQACAPLAALTTDNTGNFSSSNPFVSDGLGNYTAWAVPGYYRVQAYSSNFGLSVYATGVACVPGAAAGCVGTFGGTVTAGQVVYASAPNILASSPNFLWSQAGQTFSLFSTTPATAIANQNSPILQWQGNYWNGSASAVETCTVQGTLNAGTNPQGNIILNCTGSSGGSGVTLPPNVLINNSAGGAAGSTTYMGGLSGSFTIQAAPNAGAPTPAAWWTLSPVSGQFLQGGTGSPNTLTWVTTGVQCGTMAANAACSNTLTTAEHFIGGIAILSGGTSTFTGILPAFTSASTFFCTGNDITTPANTPTVIPASANTVTVTGTGTDHIQFVCVGG